MQPRMGGERRGGSVCIPAIFILTGYTFLPRTIKISNGEISQERPFWKTQIIPVTEIASASFKISDGAITILGSSGVKIIHTVMHSNYESFTKEIRDLTGREVAPFLDGEVN